MRDDSSPSMSNRPCVDSSFRSDVPTTSSTFPNAPQGSMSSDHPSAAERMSLSVIAICPNPRRIQQLVVVQL